MRILGFIIGLFIGAYVGDILSPQYCITSIFGTNCTRPENVVLIYKVVGALMGGGVLSQAFGLLETAFGDSQTQKSSVRYDVSTNISSKSIGQAPIFSYIVCPKCGRENRKSTIRCLSCNETLDRSSSTSLEPKVGKYRTCFNCMATNLKSDTICDNCCRPLPVMPEANDP